MEAADVGEVLAFNQPFSFQVYKRWVHDVVPAVDVPGALWSRYSNPFEQKFVYKGPAPELVWTYMETQFLVYARLVYGIPQLQVDETRHYAGLFRYDVGQHLAVHVDAGIHPLSPKGMPMRKRVTALLYLNDAPGDLEFWQGESCSDTRYVGLGTHVQECLERVAPRTGRAVLFENTDTAWHGVAKVEDGPSRYVATVSFIHPEPLTPQNGRFNNMRQRAFFTPRPDEEWDEAIYKLRDVRADPERYAEAYRTE